MEFQTRSLREYPYQPIKNFAEARNWFTRQLKDEEYVLFISEQEEVPQMLLDYIRRLKPRFPYYMIRVIELVNGRLTPCSDPGYRPNLCSNRMRFVGQVHEAPRPRFPAGFIDIPMIHNSDGSHSYSSWAPAWYSTRYYNVFKRFIMTCRTIVFDEFGHGLGRKRSSRREY